jgi:hypothetical protein
MSRRGFLTRCATAAATAGALSPIASRADDAKPRVAVVFLANSSGMEMWPYPNYDCPRRHAEILNLLKEGCPQVEFVPVVVSKPAEVEKAIALKDTVDGYLVYTVTLMWGLTSAILPIGKLGKPMCVADEYLGVEHAAGGSRGGGARVCRREEARHDAGAVRAAMRPGLSAHVPEGR